MGGGALSISIIFHIILLVIGIFWVLRVIKPPDKVVDFMPPSGGGGAPDAQKEAKQRRVQIMKPDLARIAAVGTNSQLTLPEPDPSVEMSSLQSLSSSLSSGMGGHGSGGGRGDGNGKGVGNGSGLGNGMGSGMQNPFGMIGAAGNALVGNFYDLKQTKDGKPTGVDEAGALKILSEFVNSSRWNAKVLEEYYKAPNTLYQTKIYIPIISAALAPEAFGCGKEVQPVNWVAHYRGMVSPPKSGRFRLVGRADNVMVVRFNGKVVLDGGDYSAALGRIIWDPTSIATLAGGSNNRDMEKEMRRGGYDIPVKSYQYPDTGQYNERGGVMVGKEFTVRAGQRYPVEIILSELGGLFGASLLIEESGAKYEKAPSGDPILPLFQFDSNLPNVPKEVRGSPPFDPNGPVWKVVLGEAPNSI